MTMNGAQCGLRGVMALVIFFTLGATSWAQLSEEERLRTPAFFKASCNRLLTIPGGDHGDFTAEQQIVAFEAIHQFLANLGITAVAKQ